MERIAIAGLSLQDSDLSGLERAKAKVTGREQALAHELTDVLAVSDLVLISTCNRVEVAYAREEGQPPDPDDLAVLARALGLGEDPLGQRMHFHSGRAAARHLFRVVSSLDSLVLGEDQILGQVRDAFARAEADRLCGGILRPLFQAALEVGKQVRAKTELSLHPVSVVSIAVEQLRQHAPQRSARVAVLGAGAMGELLARHLVSAGCPPALFANRSLEGARRLAAQFGGEARTLEQLRAAPPTLDALFSATSALEPVLESDDLARLVARVPSGARLLAVDLAVPRDLAAFEHAQLERVNIETLRERARSGRALRRRAVGEAEALIENKLEVFSRRLMGRVLSHALAEMQTETADILERELAHLRSERLAALPPEQRVAVERWARTTFGRLAHVPVSALKRFAEDAQGGSAAAEEAG